MEATRDKIQIESINRKDRNRRKNRKDTNGSNKRQDANRKKNMDKV